MALSQICFPFQSQPWTFDGSGNLDTILHSAAIHYWMITDSWYDNILCCLTIWKQYFFLTLSLPISKAIKYTVCPQMSWDFRHWRSCLQAFRLTNSTVMLICLFFFSPSAVCRLHHKTQKSKAFCEGHNKRLGIIKPSELDKPRFKKKYLSSYSI